MSDQVSFVADGRTYQVETIVGHVIISVDGEDRLSLPFRTARRAFRIARLLMGARKGQKSPLPPSKIPPAP